MADTKYTILGMTSSGKTCYITGMYTRMSAGIDGFTLVIPDDSTRVKLERDIRSLRQPNGPGRFPQATAMAMDAIKHYEFNLNLDRKKIISFDMIDYAGGSLVDGGDVYKEVVNSISESTALFFFIDGALFCNDSREERKDNVHFDCAMTMTPIIQKFADTHPDEPLPPIVFVVTKGDLCKQYVQQTEIVTLIKEFFSPAFGEDTTSYICVVSLGDTISDDEYKGKYAPLNIHIPFFIGAYHDFYNRCVLEKEAMNSANMSLAHEEDEIDRRLRKERKKFAFKKRKELIKRLENSLNINKRAREDNLQMFDQTRDLLSRFGERLERDSNYFKYFVNGVEQDKFRRFRL